MTHFDGRRDTVHTSTNSETLSTTGEMPVLVIINRIPTWQASGRTFPVVAGAEDPPADANTDDQESDSEGGDDFDKPRALDTIRKQRDEIKRAKEAARATARERDELRSKVKEREDADKSEGDRLKEQLAEAQRKADATEKRLRETQTRISIERAATRAGATDPEDVFRLLDTEDFDLDDDGALLNADKLVTALLKAKPYLSGKGNGSVGVPSTPRSNGVTMTHEDRVKANKDILRGLPDRQPL